MYINCPQQPDDKDYRKFTFPAGEPHIVLLNDDIYFHRRYGIDVEFNFRKAEDLVELILLGHTLRENNIPYRLILPYMPFGQADRVNEEGECFSLKAFAEIVNTILRPRRVEVYDPHSHVTPALLNNCEVRPQWEIVYYWMISQGDFFEPDRTVLVSPDAGAQKKIEKLSETLDGVPVVYCSKQRDTKTGQITGTKVDCDDLQGRVCVIVDDICVGGRTFVEIAKVLRSRNAGRIVLCTTNGVYSNGLEVFDGLIDEIWNRNGRVK